MGKDALPIEKLIFSNDQFICDENRNVIGLLQPMGKVVLFVQVLCH